MRVPALVSDMSVLWVPLAALVVTLLSLAVVYLVPGPTSGPVVLAVGFGPTAGGAVVAGYRNTVCALPLLGLVPTLTLVAVVVDQSLRFGDVDQMVWLVSVVVLVRGFVVATVGFALGRGVAALRAWLADRS